MARKLAQGRAAQRLAAVQTRVRRNWHFALAPAALLLGGDLAINGSGFGPVWSARQIAQLKHWADAASEDALPRPDTAALDSAIRKGHPLAVNRAASELALRLGTLHLLGTAPPDQRIEWFIADSDAGTDLAPALAEALASDRLDAFFAELRPDHASYATLRTALAEERDETRRTAIARTMERWRWLPRSLGADYVIANAAGFDVNLWRGGTHVKRWAAISGKTSSQTPSLKADVVAVNFNPWWEVPVSIAKESNIRPGGRYQWNGNHFRQPPGPGNALGQMKLLMPNKFNIYLHDTPSRGLFGADSRAFSHGCMRVGNALDFAATLLEGVRTRDQIDKIVNPKLAAADPLLPRPAAKAEPKSTVVSLPSRIPVYVTYMTVTVQEDGSLAFHKDIYGRDAKIAATLPDATEKLALR